MNSWPTRVKPGTRDESSLVPVRTPGSAAIERTAYQRAPTLMAGVSAGTQGQVRVWAPSRKLLWVFLAGWGVGSLALFVFRWIYIAERDSVVLFLLYHLTFMIFGVYYRAFRRPCYITTDDAGIGLTSAAGSLTLRWCEIKAVRIDLQSRFSLGGTKFELMAPKANYISLTGYPIRHRKELLSMIVERSELEASDRHDSPRLFIQSGYKVFGDSCQKMRALGVGMTAGATGDSETARPSG